MNNQNPYESPRGKSVIGADVVSSAPHNWKEYSSKYNAAFRSALLIQASLALLTALVLDFGQTHRAFWVAFVCQWATVWIILFRRPIDPTWFDMAIVRFGIIPILILVAGLGPSLLRWLGIQP